MPHENVDVRIECWVKVCVDLRCWESSIPIAYHPVDTLKLVARAIKFCLPKYTSFRRVHPSTVWLPRTTLKADRLGHESSPQSKGFRAQMSPKG